MQTTPTTTPFTPNFWPYKVVKELLLPKKVQTQMLDIRKKNHHN
jgi:hypothetical protein